MSEAGFIIENMIEQTNESTLKMTGEIERHSVLITTAFSTGVRGMTLAKESNSELMDKMAQQGDGIFI